MVFSGFHLAMYAFCQTFLKLPTLDPDYQIFFTLSKHKKTKEFVCIRLVAGSTYLLPIQYSFLIVPLTEQLGHILEILVEPQTPSYTPIAHPCQVLHSGPSRLFGDKHISAFYQFLTVEGRKERKHSSSKLSS